MKLNFIYRNISNKFLIISYYKIIHYIMKYKKKNQYHYFY